MSDARAEPGRGRVAIANLVKRYHDQVAVDGVSLTIAPGQFVALLGPSGCGKTTILRCIAGLIAPDRGDIDVDGRSILVVPAHRRDLGMVFQSYALFPHMTVAQNVAFGLRMRRMAKDDIAGRVARALDLVKLPGLDHRLPKQLSGGQQQRVALARALVTEPTVLLLDEPLAALDAKLREAMQIELRQLQRRLGLTTIFVTHDQGEALTMADQIAVMSQGRIEQVGSAEEIYDQPRSIFVADFIGQMNKLRARIIGGAKGRWQVAIDGAGPPLTVPDNGDFTPSQPVTAMIRPEKIRLGTHGDGLAARISEIVFSGEKVTYYLESAAGGLIAVATNTHGAMALRRDASVCASWRSEDVLLFGDHA